jgi:lipoprotein-releasing system ATP-binding protein
MNKTVLHCTHLEKIYGRGTLSVEVFSDIALSLYPAQSLAIMGSSGSGKSTLLHILGGLDRPSQGEVFIQNTALSGLTEKALGILRNRTLGFVYQFHHLLPEFTALENVAMPLLIRKILQKEAFEQAAIILQKVGLEKRFYHKPSELSGGERQRVAIARSMVTKPICLLADEPTGNLDSDNAERILDLLLSLNEEMRTSLLVATHDTKLAKRVNQVRFLERGRLT